VIFLAIAARVLVALGTVVVLVAAGIALGRAAVGGLPALGRVVYIVWAVYAVVVAPLVTTLVVSWSGTLVEIFCWPGGGSISLSPMMAIPGLASGKGRVGGDCCLSVAQCSLELGPKDDCPQNP
jgi:hypothetical protein